MAKGSMDIAEREEGRPSRCSYTTKERKDMFIIILVLVVCTIIGAITIAFSKCDKEEEPPAKVPYENAAVASDATPCSIVGRDILKKGGSAVDAAVATQFCLGVVIPHSTGIGGGGFLVFYNKTSKDSQVYNFRETAPAAASRDMFKNVTKSNIDGGISIAVPGMVKGLHAAWKNHGVLQWKDLIMPAVKLAKDGVKINKALNQSIQGSKDLIKSQPGLKSLFMVGSRFKTVEDVFKLPKLAETMEAIAADPDSFYNGNLAKKIEEDMNENNGSITLADLNGYKINQTTATTNDIDDFTMMTAPPPSSGIVMAMILNIFKGYKPKPEDVKEDKAPLTYHRMVEAFKFAYARRGQLGDPAFVDVNKVVAELLSHSDADKLRAQIMDNMTKDNETEYGGYYGKDSSGTSHTSIISKDGDAVSVTSTINYWFGSGVLSESTGILYNNEMGDFSTPGKNNVYGYPPSQYNFIEPGKRPMSSMSPVIVVDKNGDVRVVAGASGGSRIITGTAQVVMNNMMFGMNAWDAVTKPRLHHQLLPRYVQVDEEPYKMADNVIAGLKNRGHVVNVKTGGVLSNTQAVTRGKDGKIYAMSDPRKHAEAAGY